MLKAGTKAFFERAKEFFRDKCASVKLRRMTPDLLYELLHAVPFVPFRVHVAAHPKPYDVPHPDFALLTHRKRVLVVAFQNKDAVHLISVPLITKIETATA